MPSEIQILMLATLAFYATMQIANPIATSNPVEKIQGHWKGLDMFQDENSYDGKTVYLPNSEELNITANRVSVYFYPYFKSDEFDAAITSKSIVYSIGRKRVKSDYSFIGDTLVLSMNFINKTFIKMYEPFQMEEAVVAELDEFGFNPSALTHEFELDTLHPNLRKGYKDFDSLNFELIKHIQFLGDDMIKLNRGTALAFSRGYQSVRYSLNGKNEEFRIYKVEGTQQFSMIPFSQCNCDSIHIPYIVVSWADRVRKRIYEDSMY